MPELHISHSGALGPSS